MRFGDGASTAQASPKYVTSLLTAWWRENATAENGFAFNDPPKRSTKYSHITEPEAEKIHASLMLPQCNGCHSGETMRDLALLTSDARLGIIREIAKNPESGIPVVEAEDILESHLFLLGF